MARNGSGTFSSSVNFVTEAASAPIEISKLDTAISDLGDEITNSIAADGQTSPSADLPMNGHRHTNVAAATALTHYARVSELIDQDHIYYVDSGSANTYAITPSPAISAYEEGQRFVFRAANANSGASTLNVNSLGAIAIQTPDASALGSGAIVAGGYYEVVYDANTSPDRWVLMSPPSEIPASMLPSTVWTSANDGSGSGLDADKLDGSEGSAYAKLAASATFNGALRAESGHDFLSGVGTFLDWNDTNGRVGTYDADTSTWKEIQLVSSSNYVSVASTGIDINVDSGTLTYNDIEVGFRYLPLSQASTSYTLQLTDSGNVLRVTNSPTITIPADSTANFDVGTVITMVAWSSSATVTIAPDTGVSLYLAGTNFGSTGNRSLSGGGIATLIKLSSNAWMISGSGLS